MTPNDHYCGRTAPLTSKRCILYIYSTNIGTEYFKHGIYSPIFFSSICSLFHNSNAFGSFIIHILYTRCAKIKKIYNSGAKRLMILFLWRLATPAIVGRFAGRQVEKHKRYSQLPILLHNFYIVQRRGRPGAHEVTWRAVGRRPQDIGHSFSCG